MEPLVHPCKIYALMKTPVPPTFRRTLAFGVALFVATMAWAAPGQVVINEIMYHPPADREDLQFVELYNTGKEAVDLSGWRFSKGLKFTFANGTKLAPNAYLVVCSNRAAFATQYGNDVPLAGEFEGHLSGNGEAVELSDKAKKAVDSVKYADDAPWPTAADGESSSLERICPTSPGDDPANWAASNLPEIEAPSGRRGGSTIRFPQIFRR